MKNAQIYNVKGIKLFQDKQAISEYCKPQIFPSELISAKIVKSEPVPIETKPSSNFKGFLFAN